MATRLDHYRLLGRSGLRVSPLCLGTMTFGTEWGWGSDEDTSKTIFDNYVDHGGNFIDTADLYTNGTSETFVGKFAKDVGRDRLVLATKFTFNGGAMGVDAHTLRGKPDPNAGGNHRKHLRNAIDASLKRLATDYIDLYWVHAFDGRTPVEETMRALDDAVKQGKILYVGVSDYPAWKVAQANTLAMFHGWSPFVALQVEYSLVERTTERDLIPMAIDLGLGVTPWSPLAQGALTGKFLDGSADDDARLSDNENRMGRKYVSEPAQAAARATVEVAKAKGVSASRVALAWLLHQPGVTSPIIGARKTGHLEDNLDAVSVDLSADELAKLDEATAIEPGFPHDFLTTVDAMITANATVEPPPQGRLV
jgi:aryl-alcohol dehydrogenase-like predicted oxidoreductase